MCVHKGWHGGQCASSTPVMSLLEGGAAKSWPPPCNPRRMCMSGCGFCEALQVQVQLGLSWDCSDETSCLLASLSNPRTFQ